VYNSSAFPWLTNFNGRFEKFIANGLLLEEIWYVPDFEPAVMIQLKVVRALEGESLKVE
jgi:hypothetical protein